MLTAFKTLEPGVSIRLLDVIVSQNKKGAEYVIVKEDADPDHKQRKLKLHKRRDGTHYFNYKHAEKSYRIDTQDFVVLW